LSELDAEKIRALAAFTAVICQFVVTMTLIASMAGKS
jgi:recombinational DNA repair ATPase RecF